MKYTAVLCSLSLVCAMLAVPAKAQETGQTEIPRWVTDEGRRATFPTAQYVSQCAHGADAEEARSRAAAAISAYIKTAVHSKTTAHRTAQKDSNGTTWQHTIEETVRRSSDNELYQLEFTATWYDAEQNAFACVAYIDRERAFAFVRPKLENAAQLFPAEYGKALQTADRFQKVVAVRRCQKLLEPFYAVYDFARAINAEKAAEYESLDHLARASYVTADELATQTTVSVSAEGDKNGLIKGTLERILADRGFSVVADGQGDYQARATVAADIRQVQRVFVSYPSVTVEICGGADTVASYAGTAEKAAGFDRETAERAAYSMAAKHLAEHFLR